MRIASTIGLGGCLLAACLSAPAVLGQGATPLRLTPLDSPAAPNSAEPQLSATADGVLLSWIERAGTRATLKFAERTPAGWSAAKTVASGSDWFVNWADVPSVIKLSNGTLVAHWLQKNGPDAEAYDVRLAYSTDQGRTWSPSFLPHHDGTKTEHGFASLLSMPGGGLGLVWLDGRAMPSGHGAGHDEHGAMALRFAAFDANWKQIADAPVDAKVCECCPTAAAVTADGPIVAFRNRSDDEVRDIYVSRQEGGKWTEPTAVSDDHWKIAACPVNGPALSARGRDVAIAWFSGSNGQNRAMAAFSSDAGRTFSTPVRLDEKGSLGRVDIDLLEPGRAVVSWIEHASGVAQFRARMINRAGAASAPLTIAPMRIDRSSGYPRIARLRDELIVAWTESVPAQPPATGNVTRVRTATVDLRK